MYVIWTTTIYSTWQWHRQC